MKHTYYLITILITFLVQSSFAQSNSISGKVTEKGNGVPLPGVSVIVQGEDKGGITDFDGNYSFEAKNTKGKTLVFSSMGYKTASATLTGGSQTVNISLDVDATSLDEVVVTALGIKKEAKALGYSLTNVKGDDLANVKATSAINSLQGRVAGVNISTSNTGAAGSSRVIIRGASSLTGNNQPLYVVDGIPIINNTNGSVSGAFGGQHGDGGDDVSSINPDDIESVSVLKGSSAAALYGSKASNGVIMITTKSGNKQKGFGIEFSSSLTFDNINTSIQNLQTSHGQGVNGLKPGYEYDGGGNPIAIVPAANAISNAYDSTLQSWGPKLDGSMVYNWDGTQRAYSNTGNNLDKFYNSGITMINSIAFAKGSENSSYRFSFSNLENDDIFPNTTLNRKSFSLNASAKINPKLTSSVNVKYIIEKVHNRATVGDTPGNANTVAFVLPNSLNITDLNPGSNSSGTELRFQPSQFITNPYWATNKFNNDDQKNRFIVSGTLKYDINDWLYVTGRAGTDTYDLSRRQVTPLGTAYQPSGKLYQSKATYSLFDADVMLGVNKKITDKISTNSILGVNTRKNTFELLSATGSGFVDPTIEDLGNTTLPTPVYSFSPTKTNSVYGSVEVDYNSMFFVTVTGRNDWFSTLSYPGKTTPNNQFYWSLSSSLLLNKALELPEFVNYAKLRASYAQVAGGANQAFALNRDYAITGSFQGQPFGQINGQLIPNPDLVPFQKNEFEVGLDGRFLKNRMNFDIAYYKNSTTKDIVAAAAGGSSGYTSALLNIGELQNKGIEVLIGGSIIKKEDFSWYSSFNVGYNNSEIIHTDDEDTPINVDGSLSRSKTAIISHMVGEHYGVIYGSTYERDAAGNIVYDISGGIPKAVQGENKILGQGVAPTTLGFANTFKYKDFSLNMLIDAKFGGQVHSGTNRELMLRGLHEKTIEGRENGLVVNGVDTAGAPFSITVAPEDLQTYYGFIGAENSGIAEEFVYDTDFIKFRELSLSYNLPTKYLNKTFLNNLKFSVVGRNLFYIMKKVDNIDPEASLNNLNSQGIERFGLPSTRSIGFTLNAKF